MNKKMKEHIQERKLVAEFNFHYWILVENSIGLINDEKLRYSFYKRLTEVVESYSIKPHSYIIQCDEENNPPEYVNKCCPPAVTLGFKLYKNSDGVIFERFRIDDFIVENSEYVYRKRGDIKT